MRRIKGCFSSVAEEMACGYNIVNIHSVATTCKEDLCIGIFSHRLSHNHSSDILADLDERSGTGCLGVPASLRPDVVAPRVRSVHHIVFDSAFLPVIQHVV